MKTSWPLLWLTLVGVLVLVNVACGGSSADGSPSLQPDTSADAGDGGVDGSSEAGNADAQTLEAGPDGALAKCTTPKFSLPGGVYHGQQEVGLSGPEPGVTIYYTLDGSDPTRESTVYTWPIMLVPVSTTMINAFASAPGFADSNMTSATYQVLELLQASAPQFSPPGGSYATPQAVAMASATPGATIYYALDGTEPTASSPSYVSPLSIDVTTTIKAFTVAPGYQDSPVSTATYCIQCGPKVATPVFSLHTGTYSTPQTVEIQVATPNAQIHYTLDGSEPTTMSPEYMMPIHVEVTTTLKAFAVAAGMADSDVAEATYTFGTAPIVAATPVFDPPGGVYLSPQSVAIQSTTAGAEIRFTVDGTDPTFASPVYTAPVNVAQSLVLRSFAHAPNYDPSVIAQAIYTIDPSAQAAAAPTISPNGGTFCQCVEVELQTSEPNGAIRYTTDGTQPTSAWAPMYTAPLVFCSHTHLAAVTTSPGKAPSAVTHASFDVVIGCAQVMPVVISPGTQTSFNDLSVTLSSQTAGATVCYSLDSSVPTCALAGTCQTGQTYAGAPIVIAQTETTLTARACMVGVDPSATSQATYTLEAGPVSFSPDPGTVSPGTAVSFATLTSGATMRYRTDGVDPTCTTGESFDPSGPAIPLSQSTTFRVIACKAGYAASAVAVASYVIVPG